MGVMDKKKVFEILSPGKRAPRDYQFAQLHMVFDVKDDGTHKARFVAVPQLLWLDKNKITK